jgi:hypothetical protein
MSGHGGQEEPRDDPGPCDNQDGPTKLVRIRVPAHFSDVFDVETLEFDVLTPISPRHAAQETFQRLL